MCSAFCCCRVGFVDWYVVQVYTDADGNSAGAAKVVFSRKADAEESIQEYAALHLVITRGFGLLVESIRTKKSHALRNFL